MDDKAYIQKLLDKARAAEAALEHYTQEQTDALVKAIGKVIYDNRELLSREARDETGLGVYEHKIVKHANVTMFHWHYLKDQKSVGVIEDDPLTGITSFAKPVGVVGCITPVTNPTTTAAGNCMCAVKSRNAVIVAPHPKAKKCTAHAVSLMNDAIVALGGPDGLIQTIEEPTIALTNLLISMVDVVIATGGPAMVKSAYSSGKPSFGVGPGNVQVVVDEDFDDLEMLTARVMASRAYDNGMPCTGEQTLHVPRARQDEIVAAFVAKGGYLIEDPADLDKLRQVAFDPVKGTPNVAIVGKLPPKVGETAGIKVPDDAKLLLAKLDKHAKDEPLCREIMCPFVRFYAYDTFEEGVAAAKDNLLMEGAGHSAAVYSTNEDRIRYVGQELPVSRVMACQATSAAGGNTVNNGLVPTISLGCGSWGNNSISDNLTYKHLLNITRVSRPIVADVPTPEEIWA